MSRASNSSVNTVLDGPQHRFGDALAKWALHSFFGQKIPTAGACKHLRGIDAMLLL
jgi:hypothetical protein